MQNDTQIRGTAFFLHRNLILYDGLIAAPAAFCTDSLPHALLAGMVFCCVTLLTVLIGLLIPRRLPFTLRILSYSVIAALVYIPSVLAADYLIGGSDACSLYLPLLSSGLLLTAGHDRLFVTKKISGLLARLACMLIGVCAVLLIIGAFRELLGAGTIFGTQLLTSAPVPALLAPAAGMVLLAVLCCAAHALQRFPREEETDDDACD